MREIIDLNCSYSQLSCSSKTVTLGTGSKRSSKRNVRCFIECYILVHELPRKGQQNGRWTWAWYSERVPAAQSDLGFMKAKCKEN